MELSDEQYTLIGKIVITATKLESLAGSIANVEWPGKKSEGNRSLEHRTTVLRNMKETLKELIDLAIVARPLARRGFKKQAEKALSKRDLVGQG